LAPDQTNLLHGTLDMMILRALTRTEMHCLGISRRIEQITKGTFQVEARIALPRLHRMEEQGWLVSLWGESQNNRCAKVLQADGRGTPPTAKRKQNDGAASP